MPDIEFAKYTGHNVDKVKKLLTAESGDDDIHVIPNGSFVTMDYRTDRLRIWYDPDNRTVTSISRG